MMNSSIPTEITRHIYVRFFAIQGWKEADDIIMHNIPGIINPANNHNKPLDWVLNDRNVRYMMGCSIPGILQLLEVAP